MDNYILQWESPFLGFYWNYNFVYMVYKKNILSNIYGYQEKNILVNCEKNNFAFYVHKSELRKCAEVGYQYFVKKESITRWRELVDQNTQKIYKINVSKKYSIKNLSYIEDLFHTAVGLHYVTQPLYLKKIEDEFNNLCKKYNISDEIKNLLLSHFEMTEIMEEQYQWYKIILLQKIRAIRKHLKKWKYITAGDSKQPMDYIYLLNRYKTDSVQINLIKKQFNEIEKIKNGCLYKQYLEVRKDIPLELDQLANILRTLSFVRFQTKQNWMKLWYVLENSLSKTNKRKYNVFDYTLSELTDREIEKGIDDRSSYLYIKKNGDDCFYYNGLNEKIKGTILKTVDYKNINELTGTTGFPGNVKGYVLRLDWNENINTKRNFIKPNTILVVPQTTPSFVSLLSQCVGVITDEGGIAGHASIISRELKIPSLIGTKIATKVFEDNDYIELNTVAQYAKKIGKLYE